MKILFTIPHYYSGGRKGPHGSLGGDAAARVRAITTCLVSIHGTFGGRQGLIDSVARRIRRTNQEAAHEIDVVVCTTGDEHLASGLEGLSYAFRHRPTDAEPKLLGYECHAALQENLCNYDYYCYLEDDLEVKGPLFFVKLDWFRGWAGDDCVLQPNRFEAGLGAALTKYYHDGNLVDPAISPRFQDRRDRPRLRAEALGRVFTFQRVDNPHAGCFFLSAGQMARWAEQPYFLDRASGFWGPLESAATLGVMRTFRVYKPSRECAGFLEVRHLGLRFLNRLPFGLDPPDPPDPA